MITITMIITILIVKIIIMIIIVMIMMLIVILGAIATQQCALTGANPCFVWPARYETTF